MSEKFDDYIGKKYGRWTVLSPLGDSLCYSLKVRCRCDCGTERDVSLYTLKRGNSVSCGCLRKELVSNGVQRLTYSDIVSSLSKNGYLIATPESDTTGYALSKYKFKFTCLKHGEQIMSGASIRKGCSCIQCARERTAQSQLSKYEDVKAAFDGSQYVLLTQEDEYTGSKGVLRYVCPVHGEKFTTWDAWRVGKRCKECSQSLSESKLANELKQFCKQVYPDTITEYAPIASPKTNYPLYFDIYIPSLGVFCEIMGQQHYEYCKWFHGNDRSKFDDQVYRDSIKEAYAWDHGRYVFVDLRCENDLNKAISLLTQGRGRVANWAGELKHQYIDELPWTLRNKEIETVEF